MSRYGRSDYTSVGGAMSDALEEALVQRAVAQRQAMIDKIAAEDRARKMAAEDEDRMFKREDRTTAARDRDRRIVKEDADLAFQGEERGRTREEWRARPVETREQEADRTFADFTRRGDYTHGNAVSLQDDSQAHATDMQRSSQQHAVRQEASRRQWEDSHRRDPVADAIAINDAKAKAEREGKAGGKLGVAAQARVATGDTSLSIIDELEALHKDPEVSSRMGPLKGRIGQEAQAWGFARNDKFARFVQLSNTLRNMTIQARTGAQLSQHEDKRISQEIASPADDPKILWPEKVRAQKEVLAYLNWRTQQLASGAPTSQLDAIGLDGFRAMQQQEQGGGGDLAITSIEEIQ